VIKMGALRGDFAVFAVLPDDRQQSKFPIFRADFSRNAPEGTGGAGNK